MQNKTGTAKYTFMTTWSWCVMIKYLKSESFSLYVKSPEKLEDREAEILDAYITPKTFQAILKHKFKYSYPY